MCPARTHTHKYTHTYTWKTISISPPSRRLPCGPARTRRLDPARPRAGRGPVPDRGAGGGLQMAIQANHNQGNSVQQIGGGNVLQGTVDDVCGKGRRAAAAAVEQWCVCVCCVVLDVFFVQMVVGMLSGGFF